MEQNLEQMIGHCEQIVKLMNAYHVVDLSVDKENVMESFRYSLVKFGAYLSDVNGVISEEEQECIKQNLGICPDIEVLREIRHRENLSENKYGKTIPMILKYCVLADVKKLIPNDPFKNQKAQIVVDTYQLFGQHMMACQNEDSIVAAKKLTDFIQLLTSFLEEFDLKCTSMEKLYTISFSEEKNFDELGNDKLEKILEEFNSMIGLESVKQEVNSLVNLLKVQKMRRDKNMKISDVSKHMVFSGNPGTGKTTVARILADVYKNLGALKKGQLVEVDRSGLVKGFVGQTATNVMEVVDSALGGILFIDEAYTLTVGKGNGDFGQEAVDTLLKAMEDHRDDLVVIVAGYPDLMDEFLESNPGLKSRFNKFIYFDDYDSEELLDILKNQCEKQQYSLSEKAEKYAKEFFENRVEQKPDNFANARDVRNFLERAITNHASRVVNIEDASEECLSVIEEEDIKGIVL